MIINDELVWKETVVTYFRVTSQYLPHGTEETVVTAGPRFEQETSPQSLKPCRYRCQPIRHTH